MPNIPLRSLDPLQILPPELWVEIIRQSLSDKANGNRYYADSLLGLLNVSSLWSSLLLSTPTLWGIIVIDERQNDFEARLCALLHLSNGTNISVEIYELEWENHSQILHYLLPKKEVITSVDFRCWEYRKHLAFLQALGPCTNLLRIVRGTYTYPPHYEGNIDILLAIAPRLQYLKGMTISPEAIENSIIPYTLRKMTVIDPSAETLKKLSTFPDLHTLHAVDNPDVYFPDSNSNKSSTLRSQQHYIFTPLQTLQITCGYGLFSSVISASPNLRDLKIDQIISIKEMSTLLEGLQSSTLLTHLSLRVTVDDFLELRGICLSQVTCFFVDTYRGGADQQEHDLNVKFFESLTSIMPSVVDLSLYGDFLALPGLSYAQRLPHLKNLQLYLPTIDAELPEPYFTFNSIAALECSGATPLEFFRFGQFPKLSSAKLQFTPFISDNIYPTSPLGSYIPSNLTHLEIALAGMVSWDLTAFHQLESISVLNSYNPMPLIGGFLEALISTPRNCPRLTCIDVKNGRWEWDLLILLLEQRNFLQDPGVASIERIGTTAIPSYKLLRPITQLLGSEKAERGLLEEYSLDAISKVISDYSMKGCESCCWMFTGCDTALLPGQTYDDRESGQLKKPLTDRISDLDRSDPPLPLGIEEWLSETSERRDQFRQKRQEADRSFRRENSCSNALHSRGVKITSTSLHGARYADDYHDKEKNST